MSYLPADLAAKAEEADSLAQRLGSLCEAALALQAQQNTAGLVELLAEQELLRERIEPLMAHLLAARADARAADALEPWLLGISASLRGAHRATEALQEQLGAARAELGDRIATAHRRSAAVGSYGEIGVQTSAGFTRSG